MAKSFPLRLAVLLSGSGRTLENLLASIAAEKLAAVVVAVVASRGDVRGVQIAEQAGIPVSVLPPAGQGLEPWSEQIFTVCREAGADLVVMAGFLHLLKIPADFTGRVINIHPSLLPAFGGKGFHGMHVHRGVLERGCTVSGCTVHLVDDLYDHGRVLLQEAVPVLPDDSPESLAARVFAAECRCLPEAIQRIAAGIQGPPHGRIEPRSSHSNPDPSPGALAAMTRSLGNVIADSLAVSLSYGERLLKELPPDRFARFAAPGGVVVASNHPAFIYGHLSLYAPKVLLQIAHPAPPMPGHFEVAFSKDATCRDDPEGDLYPPMDEVLTIFREGYRMVTAALRSTPDEAFGQPNPAEGRMREAFPTIGSVQAFYCGSHMMMHFGQLSAWRRMEGLPPA